MLSSQQIESIFVQLDQIKKDRPEIVPLLQSGYRYEILEEITYNFKVNLQEAENILKEWENRDLI